MFPWPGTPDDMPLFFAIAASHPDNLGSRYEPQPDDLFLVVPVDDFPFQGVCDTLVETCYGMMNARCGWTFWVARKDLPLKEEEGRAFIYHDYTIALKQRWAKMVRGQWVRTEEHEEVEADPEYQHWMRQVATCVERISRLYY